MSQPFPEPWGNYLLKELVETIAPEHISWIPQTYAWQIIYLIVVVWFSLKIYEKYRVYKVNAYRRDALKWLDALPPYCGSSPDVVYRQLPALVKRTALHCFPRAEINKITAKQWDSWLDSQCHKTQFTLKCPALLTQLSYAPIIEIDNQNMAILKAQIQLWIKHHGENHD